MSVPVLAIMTATDSSAVLSLLVLLQVTFCSTSTFPFTLYRCPDPGVPEHGSREGNFFGVGYRVTYSCNNSYELLGQPSLTCVFGSRGAPPRWSSVTPVCVCRRMRTRTRMRTGTGEPLQTEKKLLMLFFCESLVQRGVGVS